MAACSPCVNRSVQRGGRTNREAETGTRRDSMGGVRVRRCRWRSPGRAGGGREPRGGTALCGIQGREVTGRHLKHHRAGRGWAVRFKGWCAPTSSAHLRHSAVHIGTLPPVLSGRCRHDSLILSDRPQASLHIMRVTAFGHSRLLRREGEVMCHAHMARRARAVKLSHRTPHIQRTSAAAAESRHHSRSHGLRQPSVRLADLQAELRSSTHDPPVELLDLGTPARAHVHAHR